MRSITFMNTLPCFPVSLIFVLGLAVWKEACGFKVDSTLNSPGFGSLIDLQTHYSNPKPRGNTPNFAKWQNWGKPNILQGPFGQLNDKISERDKRRFLLQTSQSAHTKFEHGSVLNRKNEQNRGLRRGLPTTPPPHSVIDDLIISRPSPSVQFWSKRDTKAQAIPHGDGTDASKSQRTNKYLMMDNALEQLVPNSRCKNRIQICARMPIRNLDCILHCHLSNHVLGSATTKFLFRLFKVYASYPKMLCPTFGRIYDEIPSRLKKRQHTNSVKGFLQSVGIVESAPVNVDFIKISPSSLFNIMVKFGVGEDLELVRSILNSAETAARVELSEKNLFPADFGNPMCKLTPKEGWFVSLIDAMAQHPTVTDIFLRGYWIATRALSMEMPYPINGMFAAMVFSIKLLTGVDCSIIAYAEHGKPFKCRRPIPIDEVLDSFVDPEEDADQENKYSWLVCGAHQVGIPEWVKDKEGLNARMDDVIETNTTERNLGPEYDDLDQFPNPEEVYPFE